MFNYRVAVEGDRGRAHAHLPLHGRADARDAQTALAAPVHRLAQGHGELRAN